MRKPVVFFLANFGRNFQIHYKMFVGANYCTVLYFV